MKMSAGKLRSSIRLTVVAVFLLATLMTAMVAIGLQYYFGQSMARHTASELYTATSSEIATELANIGKVNNNIIELLADNPLLAEASKQQAQLEVFSRVLEKNPLYYGLYLGHSDGSFFEVINLENSRYARTALNAAPEDRWVVMTVRQHANGRQRSFQYLDKQLRPRVTRQEATEYDVRSRPWYVGAMASDGVASSEPYLFAQLGVPGRTLSRRISSTDTVVAIDMTLSAMSDYLRNNAVSKQSEIYLYNQQGEIIASSTQDGLEPGTGQAMVSDEALIRIARNREQHGL